MRFWSARGIYRRVRRILVGPEEADVDAVMREINAALADEARRKAALEAEDAPPQREEPPPPWLH